MNHPVLKKLTVKLGSPSPMRSLRRLVPHLTDSGLDASVVDGAPTERSADQGQTERWIIRARAWADFPVRWWMDAQFGDAEVLVPTSEAMLLPSVSVLARAVHGRTVIPIVGDADSSVGGAGASEEYGVRSISASARAWAGRQCLQSSDGVVFRGERVAQQAIAQYGAPERSIVIEAGSDPGEFAPDALGDMAPQSEVERWIAERTLVLCTGPLASGELTGTLGQAIQQLYDASLEPSDTTAESAISRPIGVLVMAYGPGREQLEQSLGHLPLQFLRFGAELSERKEARILSSAAVALGVGEPGVGISYQIARALMSKTALVVIADPGTDLAALARESACGACVENGDGEAAADAVASLCSDPDRLLRAQSAARLLGQERFDISLSAKRWATFIHRVQTGRSHQRAPSALKTAVDRGLGALGVVLVSPVLGLTALAVKKEIGSPVLFRQIRPGLHGEPFEMLKFRTMRESIDGEDNSDESRLTSLGIWLREASLDELPALINVARGDLSLVGPRPLLMRYIDRYSDQQRRRMDVKPGITGWAQVNGRNTISWEEKFRLDVWYVDNRTWLRDLQILAMTVGKVLGRADINSARSATMPEFMGTETSDPEPGSQDPEEKASPQ